MTATPDTDRAAFRAWLLRGQPERWGALTAAVEAFHREYEVSERSVWTWLSGERPLPAWLRRELARSAKSAQTAQE